MEEVTGYVFRNVYRELFGDIDKYFTPFLSPMEKKGFKNKDQKEVAPENNQGQFLVPQILTNQAVLFGQSVRVLYGQGYRECNLNLGCHSQTVVPKRKGSGFLADTEELDRFFDEFFSLLDNYGFSESVKISVKTRLGIADPEEFRKILAIYNRYPLSEIIIHPRVQKDFYRNQVNTDWFAYAQRESVHPLCYNGDIAAVSDYRKLTERFPTLDRLMIGRGLVRNPGLIAEITTGKKVTRSELSAYESLLYLGYVRAYGEERNAIFKMKEVWYYLGDLFEDASKELKQIKKSVTGEKYRAAVEALFAACPIRETTASVED